MTTVATQVNGDAIRARLFTDHCGGDDAWFRSTTRLTHCRYVIDVYV
jgi:hypothetical protein